VAEAARTGKSWPSDPSAPRPGCRWRLGGHPASCQPCPRHPHHRDLARVTLPPPQLPCPAQPPRFPGECTLKSRLSCGLVFTGPHAPWCVRCDERSGAWLTPRRAGAGWGREQDGGRNGRWASRGGEGGFPRCCAETLVAADGRRVRFVRGRRRGGGWGAAPGEPRGPSWAYAGAGRALLMVSGGCRAPARPTSGSSCAQDGAEISRPEARSPQGLREAPGSQPRPGCADAGSSLPPRGRTDGRTDAVPLALPRCPRPQGFMNTAGRQRRRLAGAPGDGEKRSEDRILSRFARRRGLGGPCVGLAGAGGDTGELGGSLPPECHGSQVRPRTRGRAPPPAVSFSRALLVPPRPHPDPEPRSSPSSSPNPRPSLNPHSQSLSQP